MVKSGYLENVYDLPLEKRTITLPNLPPFVFHTRYKPKGSNGYDILRCVWIQQVSADKGKIIILDEIKINKKKELRLRYNIIGNKPKMKGKWTFGQFATFAPPEDFENLIKLAKKYKMF
ncbi:MAG: hypothetical protein K8823_809 [Cenarchaeum symbiont of Oopsacas minuta]|nr:hypothetical protein [Cenarchaeum symbiont of Oopsacas minuta]